MCVGLLLLCLPAWAASGTGGYSAACTIDSFDQEALSFISIAFMLVSSAIALTYMYSRLRHDPQAGVWAKDEAYNLLISVFLFAGILAFFTGACRLAEDYAGSDPFDASITYLNRLLDSNGLTVLRYLTYQSINDQMEATSYLYTGFTPFFGSGVSDYASYRALSSHKEFLIDFYLPIVASLNAQKQILQAIKWVAASVLLPFAFVMRLIPPTREFGNMLIALFFGLYIILPAMYAMSGQVFEDEIVGQPRKCIDCSVSNFYSFGLDGNNVVPENTVLYRLGSTIPQAVFLPNIAIIVTITCVMSLSKALRAIAV